MSITVKGIQKRFGPFLALDNIDLELPSGELTALLGPSGCGKTTLLRIIAGMEQPDAGQVIFHGEDTTNRHVREREVGFVFQHYALFRHMTVFENIAFGLRVKPRSLRPSNKAIEARVRELLGLVQLDWLADRYPNQLSGGQRQRVALARALAVEPKVLLLDEPFGALDTQVRKELRRWLRKLHDDLHITSIFVTHDQEEALEVADRIVVMNKGHIEQQGTPDEVYDKPATPFVYQFLGNVNLFHSRVHDGWAQVGDQRIEAPHVAGEALVYVRPHEIVLGDEPLGAALRAQVQLVRKLGPIVRLELRAGDQYLEVELTRETYDQRPWSVGQTVFVNPKQAAVFAAGEPVI